MIDFVKYELSTNFKNELLNNSLLEFYDKVNTKTGETAKFQNAFYRGLEFKVYYPTTKTPHHRITVEGSYHKYWNNGSHNFNDFNSSNVNDVLEDLKSKFNIKPYQCRLIQLEIGINITPPIKSKNIVKGCMFYKTTEFKNVYTSDEGNYAQAKGQRFFIKIYDKATHYKNKGFTIHNEILRIEKKFSKSKDLHKIGITTIKDLIEYGLHNFKPMLIELWDNVIFYDKETLKNHPNQYKYNSIDYWQTLTPRQRKYQLKKINKLYQINQHSVKNKVRNLIIKKVDFLNSELYQINPLYIGLKRYNLHNEKIDQNKRICLVTNLNISMQKKTSVLLSHTGLKYYYKTDKKIYNEVKRKYLSKKWIDSNIGIQIKEIAHNIRNRYNNSRTRQQPKNQLNMFNQY